MKLLLVLLSLTASVFAETPVGVAAVDITPSYPIRMSGYGNRRAESEGVALKIWAKALAFGSDAEGPTILMTVDNCGIPDAMRAEVLSRLQKKAGIVSERFAISFSHTHCAPCLKGALVNIFSTEVPPEHQAHIDQYSRELTDKMEQVALAALAERKPALLSWSVGEAKFARNRRSLWGGAVDHSVPVMFVHSPEGKLRAVFANYACHATTLSINQIHGDWPGTAMAAIERDHPGVIALMGIGCGADQNPNPRSKPELAVQHGEEIAAEVARLLKGERTPLKGTLRCNEKMIALPLVTPPTREELTTLAASKTAPIAYAAKKNIEKLDRGEKLATELPYRVQVWNWGSDLAMAFLVGEITIDYQLRLKTEFDASRLWINGYCNDALCYIPSRKVLAEGGYEGGGAMVYYDRPSVFAPGIEDRIIGAVHELMPKEFGKTYRTDVPPKPPADSLAAIQLHDGLAAELAVAEPMVVDPVAIDWDAKGRLWVVEQSDYPNGMDGNWKPGGRVRILTDTDGDGRYDRSELFMEHLPFPTGITCQGAGALVCAAPDILLAVGSHDNEVRASKVEKLFSGFYTDNYNARVNSLTLGLDGWLHGANGLLGGKIKSYKNTTEIDIAGRDIGINPSTGELTLVSGVSQQGRTRDDFDDWFGCSNSRWIYHFPLPERYVKRNPHVAAPTPSVYLPADENADVLNPASKALARFNSPDALGHITSACGLGIYRDELLGKEFAGNAFIGEVAHNLVRRLRLDPKGASFEAHRPDDEKTKEFLASQDNWTRPVQIRTGPDGALYVVDMYRAVIEHTRWIPADRLAKLDVRAGDTMGRIYRIVKPGVKLRPIKDLTKLSALDLVKELDSPNGTARDRVHSELLLRYDAGVAFEPLLKLSEASKIPAVRAQAMAIASNLIDDVRHASPPPLKDQAAAEQALQLAIERALTDEDARVRRFAVQLSEKFPLNDKVLALAKDPDLAVRYQLALSLGEWDDPRATGALGQIAANQSDDPWMRSAVVSSAAKNARTLILATGAAPKSAGRDALLTALANTAAASTSDPNELLQYFNAITNKKHPEPWQMTGIADTLKRKGIHPDEHTTGGLDLIIGAARDLASDNQASKSTREAAVRLLGRSSADIQTLHTLVRTTDGTLQKAALTGLARLDLPEVAETLLLDWTKLSPAVRSQIIATLLARDAWTGKLLDALDQKVVSVSDISPAQRQSLTTHSNAKLRERSVTLFPTNTERAKLVAQYQSVTSLKGDGANGAILFKAVCSTCHSYLSVGFDVGPKLGAFHDKPASDFITAILDPNAAVEPRYAAYAVTLKDGRAITGVISSETATSLEVTMPGGVKENLVRGDVAEIKTTGVSLMPNGLEAALTPQAMADVIAYLKSGG